MGGVDTTNDQLDLNATLWVTNQVGTELLEVTASGAVPKAGPDQTGSIDWTTAVATQVVGVDLAWDGVSVVSSTAGGVFTATLLYAVDWD